MTIIGGWSKDSYEYHRDDVIVTTTASLYSLPPVLQQYAVMTSRPQVSICGLDYLSVGETAGSTKLRISFRRAMQDDYQTFTKYLNEYVSPGAETTFREEYIDESHLYDLDQSVMPCVCKVGVFLFTRDDRVLVSSKPRLGSPDMQRLGFSACSPLIWTGDIDLFSVVSEMCRQKTGYVLSPCNLSLFSIGLDLQTLTYFFSFTGQTDMLSRYILQNETTGNGENDQNGLKLLPVVANPQNIIRLVKDEIWEPAAASGLLTLCSKRYGLESVIKAADHGASATKSRQEILTEWNRRALRPGDLPVMSNRFPARLSMAESRRYVEAVVSFLGRDIRDKDILEIGAGIGRLSERLIVEARHLTCLDLSLKMLEMNKKRLGKYSNDVEYVQGFVQDFVPSKQYDVSISSLVLNHCVNDLDFIAAAKTIVDCSQAVFIFEHTDINSQVSAYTRTRSEEELVNAFEQFQVVKRMYFRMFDDNLIFLKLTRYC